MSEMEEKRQRMEEKRERANAALKSGDAQRARRLYTDAISFAEQLPAETPAKGEPSKLAALLCNRCVANLALSELQAALRDAEAGVRAAPGWPKAHFRLGTCHMKLRAFSRAYGAFKRGWHMDTQNPELIKACQQAFEACREIDSPGQAVIPGQSPRQPEATATDAEATDAEAAVPSAAASQPATAAAADVHAAAAAQTAKAAAAAAGVAAPMCTESSAHGKQVVKACGRSGEVGDVAAGALGTLDIAEERNAGKAAVQETTASQAAGAKAAEVSAEAETVAEAQRTMLAHELQRSTNPESGLPELRLVVSLKSFAGAVLQIDPRCVLLELPPQAHNPPQPPLRVELPEAVDDAAAVARFSKKKQELVVRMPLAQPRH